MIINGSDLLAAAPIKGMLPCKLSAHGLSYGLSEVGYDIRVKQELRFTPPNPMRAMELFQDQHRFMVSHFDEVFQRAFHGYTTVTDPETGESTVTVGRTILASSVEEFQIPDNLWCEFRNKSTHARRFCDFTLGTDGEPGWVKPGHKGFLTIEGIFDGLQPLVIAPGSGILKAVFHEIKNRVVYLGKYENQENRPVPAILENIR